MFPANASHLRSMPNVAPKFLHHLFERKGCRVIKSNDTTWTNIKAGVNLFLKVNSNDSPFHSTTYSQICSALVFPRHAKSTKQAKKNSAILMVNDADTCTHVQRAVDNVCRLHDFPRSSFSVIDSSNEGSYNTNVIDFLCEDTKEFSTRLVVDQLKYSEEGGVRLSHILSQFIDVLDWEHAYRQWNSNLMLRLGNPRDGVSFKILEHVLKRGTITHPLVIETPKFDVKVNYPFSDFMTNSVYETYQYCLSIPDSALALALNSLTTYSEEDIEQIIQTHEKSPADYCGQKKIAENILAINHSGGAETMAECERASLLLFKQSISPMMSAADTDMIERVVHTFPIVYSEGLTLAELCQRAIASLSPAHGNRFDEFIKKALSNGYLLCNGSRILLDHKFTNSDILSARSVLTLSTKRNKTAFLVKWEIPG